MKRAPAAVAILSFVILCNVVLSQTPKMIEPDPYAYRASIYALAEGKVRLSSQEYAQLSLKLLKTKQSGGIMQWHQSVDGSWISEKNPGYPFLVVIFKKFGALRFAPLFYGALACLGLWFGARRWLGEWGAAFTVSLFCSAPAAMVFAWRETMPTFTDASLIACAIGLLIGAVLSIEKSDAYRAAVGALSFFAFGLAVFVRYTNVVPLVVSILFAACAWLVKRWGLPKWALAAWLGALLVPILAILAFNFLYYGSFASTGYPIHSAGANGGFGLSSIIPNLVHLPLKLVKAMPLFVGFILASVVMVIVQFRKAEVGECVVDSNDDTELVVQASKCVNWKTERGTIDRWVGLLLLGSWVGTWLLYFSYQWFEIAGNNALVNGIGDYSFTRQFVPVLGAMAMLCAWLLIRIPRPLAVLVISGFLCFGVVRFNGTVTSQWANIPWFRVDAPTVLPGSMMGPLPQTPLPPVPPGDR